MPYLPQDSKTHDCKKCDRTLPIKKIKTNEGAARKKEGFLYVENSCHTCYDLNRRYGMTRAQREELREGQEHKCAICAEHLPCSTMFCIDHSEDDGYVRGGLCDRCNRGIGYLKHDVHRLKSAVLYLLHPPAYAIQGKVRAKKYAPEEITEGSK